MFWKQLWICALGTICLVDVLMKDYVYMIWIYGPRVPDTRYWRDYAWVLRDIYITHALWLKNALKDLCRRSIGCMMVFGIREPADIVFIKRHLPVVTSSRHR
jgi:hypothetical protein